ncbi:calcineurin-like phosphoesterase family protein [Shimia isoporae]|uniref:Calcineurin-like phosphoesterase family protein n=1 Tax=Shimia isoporae TaxID=647720 RepID=A0A4R1NVV9_9RHOB|nr:metallophosphoesterase family protein [Shimia isoporae]TCL09242.1 calcineurin-like phosphoesterase family protein [Shimia isoporae]
MKIRDLGVLDGDVLLFGGPYSNLQAIEAVLIEAAARGIPASHIICTGDIVAYCGQPAETVDLVRESGVVVVAGNCEKQLAANALDCGCGFDEGSACDLLSAGWFAHADRHVDQGARIWMGGLPDLVMFSHDDRRVAVIHGGITDIARFIWSVSEEAVFVEELSAIADLIGDVDVVVAGHSGIAFQRRVKHVTWVNAGVIGMPPHDGGRDTAFALLSKAGVEIKPLRYDVQTAVGAMQRAGLTQGYERALRTGRWPSEDVLPDQLRLSDFAKG